MIEITGNLFDQEADAICITTNGFVNTHGFAIMGRGVALAAQKQFPGIDFTLGNMIRMHGNRVNFLTDSTNVIAHRRVPYAILSFPVKPDFVKANDDMSNIVPHMRRYCYPGKTLPGWASMGDEGIIMASCFEIKRLADDRSWNKVVVPRPGCGAGGLDWDKVKEEIGPILDDRFHLISL
jgi:hypothetical protein